MMAHPLAHLHKHTGRQELSRLNKPKQFEIQMLSMHHDSIVTSCGIGRVVTVLEKDPLATLAEMNREAWSFPKLLNVNRLPKS